MRGVPPPRMPCTRPTLIRTSRPCRGRIQVQKLLAPVTALASREPMKLIANVPSAPRNFRFDGLAVFSAEDPGSELRPAALAVEDMVSGSAAPLRTSMIWCGAPAAALPDVEEHASNSAKRARAPVENPGPSLASGRSPSRTLVQSSGRRHSFEDLVPAARDFRCCFCWRRRRFESFRDMSPRRYPDRSEQHCRHDRGPFARARRPARTRCRAPGPPAGQVRRETCGSGSRKMGERQRALRPCGCRALDSVPPASLSSPTGTARTLHVEGAGLNEPELPDAR